MTSVVIAGSIYLAREGFKTILGNNESFSLIGEITNKSEFRTTLISLKPDILVVDNDSKDFIEANELSELNKLSAETKILVISDFLKKENVQKLLNGGVLGYLTKECERNEILAALESIVRGEKFVCNKILDVILEKKRDEINLESDLTDREVEIIRLIAERYSNREIAEKLFISIHTVYTHRKNIMKKLNLKSPVELILYAIDKGIIPPYQN
ncbi:MAG: response regulator transcription factor [Bacteroidetes bacterium]|nr:response regulator transcription factor [Bacteroidota bacterium]